MNPYYDPEEMGLTTVGSASAAVVAAFGFDLFVVWYHPDNRRFYWATAAGCSCPRPFDRFPTLESLNSGTKRQALEWVKTVRDVKVSDRADLVSRLNAFKTR